MQSIAFRDNNYLPAEKIFLPKPNIFLPIEPKKIHKYRLDMHNYHFFYKMRVDIELIMNCVQNYDKDQQTEVHF